MGIGKDNPKFNNRYQVLEGINDHEATREIKGSIVKSLTSSNTPHNLVNVSNLAKAD